MKRVQSLVLALILLLGMAGLAPGAKAAGSKLIAITYDDGPSQYTSGLLDELKARNVKATFFMVGTNVARYPSVVSRIYQEGHQVANHSYNHPQLTALSNTGIQSQIQSVNDLLDRACGKGTSYMVRPPYGSVNASVEQAAGAPLILWSVDPLDWKYRNAETVKNNIISSAHDGAIILVHDIHATSIPGSLAAIDYLKTQGYEFVTVQELLRRRGQTPQNGKRYSKAAPNGTDLGPVAAPVITAQPEDGQLRVTITAQSGADIYYTTTGGVLNQESIRYTGPFLVSTPCTVRAVAAYNMNGSRSDPVEAAFTTPVASPPEIHVDGGLLILSSSLPGAELYYALQESEFQRYTAPVPIEPGTEISAYVQCAGYLDSPAARASYSSRGNLFRDVFPSQWYYEAMDQAVAAGYLSGVGGDRYDPAGELQRGQLAVLLYRYSGETVEPGAVMALPFTDAPKDAYYAEAIAWAYEKGIVNGTGLDTFEPLRTAERQEMSQIFFNYLNTLNITLPGKTGSADQYTDCDQIAPWAYEAVEQMTALRLLSGESGGSFNPAAKSSRVQAAAVLMRLAGFLDSQGETVPIRNG